MTSAPVRIHPAALEEAEAATEWYRRRSMRAAEMFQVIGGTGSNDGGTVAGVYSGGGDFAVANALASIDKPICPRDFRQIREIQAQFLHSPPMCTTV